MDDDESAAEPELDALQAELEAALSVGAVPDGWDHRISWDASDVDHHLAASAVFVIGSAVACGWAWGWKAGLAALVAAIGVRMLPGVRGGPRPGQEITETFTPPDETLLELGIAGHQLFDLTQSRPGFTIRRIATRADRTWSRLLVLAVSTCFVIGGTLTLLLESHEMSPTSYLRVVSLLSAVVCVGLAVWVWRQYGRLMPLLEAAHRAGASSGSGDVLDSATTGTTSETVGTELLARLPPRALRVVLPVMVLLFGALNVLVAFSITPDRSDFWSGVAASVELVVFVAAGIRAVLLVLVSVVKRDGAAFGSAVLMLLLMGALLLTAKLFGWLDDWADILDWVRARFG